MQEDTCSGRREFKITVLKITLHGQVGNLGEEATDDFELMFKKQWPILVRILYRMARDQGLSEDLAQETLFRFHERGHRLEKPEAWIYRVAIRLGLDSLKSRSRRTWRERFASGEAVLPPMTDNPLECAERHKLIQRIPGEMPKRSVLLLFSIPLVRKSAKQAFDAFRRMYQISDHNPSRDSRRPLVASDLHKSSAPYQPSEFGHESRLPYLPGGYVGGSEALPDRLQPPAYLPKNNQKLAAYRSGFEPGTEYVITGDVRSEPGEPIPGAVVSYHRSGFNYRDYEMPTPVSTQVTDEYGNYNPHRRNRVGEFGFEHTLALSQELRTAKTQRPQRTEGRRTP